MKKHDWLNNTEDSATADAPAKLRSTQRSKKFELVAADPGKRWCEDGFIKLAPWEEIAVQSKVGYLSWYAALYEVPYERFVKAVLDAVGEEGLAGGKSGDKGLFADEPWTARGQFEGARIMFGLDAVPSPIQREPTAEPEKNEGRER